MPGRADLCLLLHMHQPPYRDPLGDGALMPWVRLHGSRSYLDVASLLDEHPDVRLTVNLVPSLVEQLEAAADGAGDRYLDVALKPSWSEEERLFILARFFSVSWGRAVETRPRYRELLEKRGREVPEAEMARRSRWFSDGELRDLTVLFHLAWLGFAARAGDHEIAELERKGRGYDEGDLRLVVDRGRAACARVLPLYRRLAERGQVELTASPYYHPIVPLLCDSDCARRPAPQAALPPRFSSPGDALEQVVRGRDAHVRAFGRPPEGMWPPEGALSPEAVEIYRQAGVRWLASDEGNLWRSRSGRIDRSDLLRAWRFADVDLVFRDRDLSDRVSFSYAHAETRAAVEDLLGRARRAVAAGDPGERPGLLVALDGENPWEAYPGLGEPFLRALFAAVRPGEALAWATVGEHLRETRARGALAQLHTGSWIDSDFHVWIGDPVKNRAWGLLGQARRSLARAEGERRSGVERAREHLLAAEGSDWFWWFGEPFHSSEKALFDRLFRGHLIAAWRALGETPPPEAGEPIAAGAAARRQRPQRQYIHPKIDGRRTSYFEWLDAGWLELPRGSAMAATPLVEALHFGFDERGTLYLRLDPAAGSRGRVGMATIEVRLSSAAGELTLVGDAARGAFSLGGAAPGGRASAAATIGALAAGEIVEAELPLALLGLGPGTRLGLALCLREGEVAVARCPVDGELRLTVPDEHFAADHWAV